MSTPDTSPSPESESESDSEAHSGSGAEQQHGLTFWQVLGSTLAAAFGVQSSKNRQRDFTHGKASHFILMGIGFTVVFVLLMAGLVSYVLP